MAIAGVGAQVRRHGLSRRDGIIKSIAVHIRPAGGLDGNTLAARRLRRIHHRPWSGGPQSRRSVEHDRLLPRSVSSIKGARPANESHCLHHRRPGHQPRRPRPPGPTATSRSRRTLAGLRVIALHTGGGTGSDTDDQGAALVIKRTRSERDDWSPTRSYSSAASKPRGPVTAPGPEVGQGGASRRSHEGLEALYAQVGSGVIVGAKVGQSFRVPYGFAFTLPPGLHGSRTPQILRRAPHRARPSTPLNRSRAARPRQAAAVTTRRRWRWAAIMWWCRLRAGVGTRVRSC
jgi:hypothetical protein